VDDDAFDLADDEIADAISGNVSYFGDPGQRNLLGMEFVIGAATTLGILFLHSFLKEAETQAKRLGKLAAKRIGDAVAEWLKTPKPEREREAKEVRGKARALSAHLSASEVDARIADARADLVKRLTDAGMPEDSARKIAARTATSIGKALKSGPKKA
jgi:hypothetical protein